MEISFYESNMANCSPLLLLLLITVHISSSLKFITHPDANLNMEQKIKKYGYPLEIHQVVTEDNYILTIHRVPYGRQPISNVTEKRSPVLLLHGMAAQPEYFILLGRQSLACYLADRGFDVWILNARGTYYSQKHKYFDSDRDVRYWMFSYHEIGIYDIPANIDYIMNKTNQRAFLIGHSQGNTCYFVMTAERPEYNDKVKISTIYAPSIFLKYMDYPFVALGSYLVDVYQLIYDIIGMGMLVPVNDSVALLIKILCSETTYFLKLCTGILSMVGSHESQLITKETASLIFSVQPAKIAARQLFHYMQGINLGTFSQYDYGEYGNLRKYKSKIPPEYNITKSVAPVAIFYAQNDQVTSVKGAQEIAKALPNVILSYKVPYIYFNHIDFLFGKNASRLVYKRMAQLFKDFDAGKLRDRSK